MAIFSESGVEEDLAASYILMEFNVAFMETARLFSVRT
jgi:hypothetical protein